MNVKFLRYFIFIALLLSSSCQTMIKFPVMEDPVIKLDEGTRKIAFINRYDYTISRFENENKNEVFSNGARQLLNSLEYSFQEDEWYELIVVDSLARGEARNAFPDNMPKQHIISVCKKHNADLLLVLDYFDAGFESEVVSEEDDDGNKSSTNYVDLVVMAGFSLYRNDGGIIERKTESRMKAYQDRPMLFKSIQIGPSMKKAGKEVNIIASEIGYYYLDNFYPSQKLVPRQIYVGRDFSKIKPLMNNGQWDEAIALLLPLANSADPKLARRAAHNLSVALEASGRSGEADYWKERAGQ